MPVRDGAVLQKVQSLPFEGYSIHPWWVLSPQPNRVMVCVALLGTMIMTGIAIGTPRR